MKKTQYQEINELKDLIDSKRISVQKIPTSFLAEKSYYPEIQLTIEESSFQYFVDDEFNDLSVENTILHVCIALRSLEDYAYAEDYLVWCTQHNFEAINMTVRDHYQNLGEIYNKVLELLGEIDSKIADFDFELNAGAAQYLRKGHL